MVHLPGVRVYGAKRSRKVPERRWYKPASLPPGLMPSPIQSSVWASGRRRQGLGQPRSPAAQRGDAAGHARRSEAPWMSGLPRLRGSCPSPKPGDVAACPGPGWLSRYSSPSLAKPFVWFLGGQDLWRVWPLGLSRPGASLPAIIAPTTEEEREEVGAPGEPVVPMGRREVLRDKDVD